MNSHADIFVQADATVQLRRFAAEFFATLGIAEFEERESSSYVNGRYYRSKSSEIEVELCHADTEGLETYRFWASLTSLSAHRPASDVAKSYAQLLAAKGWSCFIPSLDWAKKGWTGDGLRYEA